MKEFRNDKLMYQTLGEHCFNKYCEAKDIEWEEYRCLVSEWELKKYLLK